MDKNKPEKSDELEKAEEELKRLLEQIEHTSNQSASPKKKRTILIISPFIFRNKYVSIIVMYLINIVCFIAILGIFNFFQLNNKVDILIIPFCLLAFELFFKVIFMRLFPKLVMKTLGTILYLISFLTALFVMAYFQKDLLFANNIKIIGFLIFYLAIRFLFVNRIKMIYLKKQLRKI